EQVPGTAYAGRIQRAGRARCSPGCADERAGERNDTARRHEAVGRIVRPGQRLDYRAAQGLITADRLADEGQRACRGCVADEHRVDVGDAVAEPALVARPPVVRLVGVQHEHLAGQAVPGDATIGERL